ncbi:hypothetical protein ACVWXM_005146 [Bradyrhizobium sp. GM7.3]
MKRVAIYLRVSTYQRSGNWLPHEITGGYYRRPKRNSNGCDARGCSGRAYLLLQDTGARPRRASRTMRPDGDDVLEEL